MTAADIEADSEGYSELQLTFSIDNEGQFWGFQSGDNSYTGGAYGLPHWAVTYIFHDHRADHFWIDEILQDVVSQWEELIN